MVLYGQTRILFAMGRDGLLPSLFAKVNPRTQTPVNNTIIVAVVVSILAGFVPLGYLADMVSIGTLVAFSVVSVGVVLLRVREPDLPRGFRVPLYPVTPVLSVLACGYIPVQPALVHLVGVLWMGLRGAGLLLHLGPPPQCVEQCRRRRDH